MKTCCLPKRKMMLCATTFLCLFTVICFFPSVDCDLKSKLKNYEVIDEIHVHSITERSVDHSVSIQATRKNVRFKGLGRKFSLHLTPVTRLFSSNFKAEIINGEGRRRNFTINQNNFYSGEVEGEKGSEVHAYLDDDNTLTASISTQGDDIVIEPEWRHQRKKSGSTRSSSMVMYKAQDMKWPEEMISRNGTGPKFCGAFHPDKEHGFDKIVFADHDEEEHHHHRHHHRSKRSTKVNCRIIAVADYKFFSSMGGGDIYRTANYIVGVIQKANLIYRGTSFSVGSGFGLEIAQMIVHESYTSVVPGARHYNMDASWRNDARGLLDIFSAVEEWSSFCLAHLFTHQAFADNVLGLAYIAGSRSSDVGGICSPSTYINGIQVFPNTGWSSTMYTGGGTVLNRQAELVTAHEFGHNWGSPHDDTGSSSCAPNSIIGDGKYLMYPYSVTGEDPNNDKFSPCSNNWINSVLQTKKDACFSESSSDNLCGNGRIDYSNNEECDAGPLGSFNLDPCCDSNCRLKMGAVCSPYNFGCCSTSCQVAPANVLCNSGEVCKNASYCDGINIGCPAAPNANRGTQCSGGFCEAGSCVPICEFNGKYSCACQEISLSCRRCCRDTPDGACIPYGVNLFLSDGQTCPKGYCESGSCIDAQPGYINKLFSFLENLSFDAIAEMFKTNMVAFTQLFSLFLFVPICIIVYCVDRKKRKRVRLEEAAEIRYDRTLTMDEDGREIRRKRKIPKMVPAGSVSSQLPPLRHKPRPPSSGGRSNRVTPLPRRF